jgi:hypothetical protein
MPVAHIWGRTEEDGPWRIGDAIYRLAEWVISQGSIGGSSTIRFDRPHRSLWGGMMRHGPCIVSASYRPPRRDGWPGINSVAHSAWWAPPPRWGEGLPHGACSREARARQGRLQWGEIDRESLRIQRYCAAALAPRPACLPSVLACWRCVVTV